MASTRLTRTPSSAGNRRTWTFSAWIKRSKVGADQQIFVGDSPRTWIVFRDTDKLQVYTQVDYQLDVMTNMRFRDTNGWYHIVVAVDTTQASQSNRVKIYVNGSLVAVTNSYAVQNHDTGVNNTSTHYIGRLNYADSSYFDGIMSHIHLVDGTALTPTSFGESDSNGVWKPKTSPSVTYGTNGFFLKMDNSGNMGLDSSGNSNNWTTTGTLTQAKDTPSNVFCTWNPFTNENANATFSNGNNTVFFNNSNEKHILATLGMNSGKFYWESKLVSHSADSLAKVGIESSLHNNAGGYAVDSYGYRGEGGGSGDASSGRKVNNGTFTNWGSSYTAGDIIGCAVDLDNNKIYFSKNGTWQESGDPTSGSTGTGSAFNLIAPVSGFYHPSIGKEASATATWSMNFGNGYFGTTAVTSAGTNASGNGIFEYDVPTGYTALSTKGLDS